MTTPAASTLPARLTRRSQMPLSERLDASSQESRADGRRSRTPRASANPQPALSGPVRTPRRHGRRAGLARSRQSRAPAGRAWDQVVEAGLPSRGHDQARLFGAASRVAPPSLAEAWMVAIARLEGLARILEETGQVAGAVGARN